MVKNVTSWFRCVVAMKSDGCDAVKSRFPKPARSMLTVPLLALALGAHASAPHTRYSLDILFAPATHDLSVQAAIELPDAYAGETLDFLLTDAVEIVSAEPPVERLPYDGSRDSPASTGPASN